MRINRRVLIAVAGSLTCILVLRLALPSSAFDSPSDSYGALRSHRVLEPVLPLGEGEDWKDVCYYDETCPSPQILFRLHAETSDQPPFACLNDIRLFDKSHVGEGVNLVALNGTTGDILDTVTIDVAVSDEKLISWLRAREPSAVIVAVSFGDVAERVSTDARSAFTVYGAKKINDWRGGSAYAIIGQRGLQAGQAHEQIITQSSDHSLVLEGCFELPLGELGYVNFTESDKVEVHRLNVDLLAELDAAPPVKEVLLGDEWNYCGVGKECSNDEISFYAFSGEQKGDFPRMCLDGRFVFDRDLNGAGRGLNIATFEPKTGRVRAVANFDTYEQDSSALEAFLESIPMGDMVAVVSFDEASTMLSEMAKQIFYEMGSSMIDRLKFRASWYFIGQKSITAFTPFEDLNIPTGNNWAKPIQKSMCLPRTLVTRKDSPSARPSRKNLQKRHFCVKHDRHDDFCSPKTIDDPIAPRPLKNKKRVGDPIFNTPILIVAGLSTPSLLKCLESLMNQEGLNTQMVLVAYDKEYSENSHLASLFHAKSVALNGTDSYNGLLLSSLKAAFSLFPVAPAVAVIEEEVILSPDWLWFLSQTLSTLQSDEKVEIVHTFNPNGFRDTSSRPSVVYRSSYLPPSYSYLMSRTLFEKNILSDTMCCGSVHLGRWAVRSASALLPEVSRITVVPPPSIPPIPWTVPAYFNRERSQTTTADTVLSNDFTSSSVYDDSIGNLMQNATVVPLADVDCANWQKKHADDGVLVVTCGEDLSQMAAAARCFRLFFDDKFVTGVYKRMLRFYANNSLEVFLVPSNSVFATSL